MFRCRCAKQARLLHVVLQPAQFEQCAAKLIAPFQYDGRPMNCVLFENWLEKTLLKNLPKKRDIIMDNAAFYQKRGTLSNLKKIFANRDLFAAVFTEADRLSCRPLRFCSRAERAGEHRPARGLAVQAVAFCAARFDYAAGGTGWRASASERPCRTSGCVSCSPLRFCGRRNVLFSKYR